MKISIRTKMVHLVYRVQFVTAQQMANTVMRAATPAAREAVMCLLCQCDLLILDEFGSLPLIRSWEQRGMS